MSSRVSVDIRIEAVHDSSLFAVAKRVFLGDLVRFSTPSPNAKERVLFGSPPDMTEFVRVSGIVLNFLRLETGRPGVSQHLTAEYPLSALIDDTTSVTEVVISPDLRSRINFLRPGDMVDIVARLVVKDKVMILCAHCVDLVEDANFESYRMLDVTTLYRELYFARKSSLLKDAGRKGLTLLRPFNHEDAEARTITWQTLQEKQQMEQAAIDEEASFQEVLAAITKAVDEADGSGVSMAQLLGILGMSRALDVESAIDEMLGMGEIYEKDGKFFRL